MIRVKIGMSDYELKDVSADWINREINGRRRDGLPACVQVIIRDGRIDMGLSTPACSAGGGGGRPPTPQEKAILDIWNQQRLNTDDFSGGNVVAFLKQLERLV
jgi:hypothetical protein